MNIELFLNGVLADVGEKQEFARNFRQTKQFSDLENPSKIVTDYSYDITLPGTDVNRRIFGWIESGTDPYHFNPNAAYPYVLNVNGYKVSSGNIQLTEILNESGRISFKCSFYSTLHGIVMDLSRTALKDLSVFKAENNYYHYLDHESMSHFWIGDHNFASILRYVPTRAGKYPNFSSSKMMVPVWSAQEPPTVTGYSGIDLGADYDEYALRDYRIEYQRPAVSVENIIKGLSGDFSIGIDASLMDSPYVRDSWLMCPQFSLEDKSESCFGTFRMYNLPVGASAISASDNITNLSQTTAMSTGDQIFTYYTVNPVDNCFSVTIECCLRFDCSARGNDDSPNGLNYNHGTIYYPWTTHVRPVAKIDLSRTGETINPNEGAYSLSGSSGNIYFTRTDSSLHGWSNYRLSYNDIDIDGWTDKSLIPIRMTFSLPAASAGYSYRPIISVNGISHGLCESPAMETGDIDWQTYDVSTWNVAVIPVESLDPQQISKLQQAGYSGHTLSYTSKSTGTSPLYVNMDTLFGSSELSCKDFLTDFTKMLGCMWDFDSSGNIKIVTRNNYFSGYQVKDWTDKLDRTSVSYKPLAFDKRIYTMSYKSGDSLLENNFKDETGKDYGKQYIDTGYAFNDDTESLLETKFLNTVQCSGQRKVLIRNYQRELKYIDQTAYELPMIEKKDNGAPNEGFRLLFNNGLTVLPKGENVYITQDSSYMYNEDIGGKCWMDFTQYGSAPAIDNNIAIMTAIPAFSTRHVNASWDFAKPQISYSGESDLSYPGEICLYPRFWSKYIGALYDAKVRVMTAAFRLDIDDLIKFSFRDFVMIDNHLWHVNKLMDFDYSGENLTNVELVEVVSPESWESGQDWEFTGRRYAEWENNTDYPDSSTVQPVLPGKENIESND